MSTINALIKRLSEEGRRLSDAAGDVAGSAADDADLRIDELRDDIRQLRRDVAVLARDTRKASARAASQGLHRAEEFAEDGAAYMVEHRAAATLALAAAAFLTIELFRRR